MPERKIIYYPTILVPARWQRRAILYWDKIGSIVPKEWDDEVENRSFGNRQADKSYSDMKYLESEGKYEPIRPKHVPLDKEFIQIVNSEFLDIDNINWEKTAIPVHKDKLTSSLYEFLYERNLVLQEGSNDKWYFMERKVSLLYMALLAKYLAEYHARLKEDYVVTGTDSKRCQTMTFRRNALFKGFRSYEANFLNILPVPRDDVSLKDILIFKANRKTELLQFREVIDGTTEKISKAEDKNEMNKILVQQEEKIKIELKKIKKAMRDSDIKATLISVRSLIDIKEPACLTTFGIALGAMAHMPALAVAGAIGVGYTWIDARNKKRAEALDSPYSYLYYGHEADIFDLPYLESRKRGSIIQRFFGC